ncbi:centrosomal protein of 290 kDa-like [Harmonia axyridis]|uniref:centrosomal protein of 290 kDa-like n=1 Tax=Harmonia axyridis TaxID=115357 RepID=UPI001E279387|nr:centrosomal protein of 290 kDa-like [Harmonia axyridis]
MSSYVNKKTRVFTSPGSTRVIQKRSESRLKSIRSATDNRAWTDCVEDRRQYILELIKTKAGGMSLGKYIPIEVIIDCLLANKNAQIEELRRQLEACRKGNPGGDKKPAPAPKPKPEKPPEPVPTKKEEPPKAEKKVEVPPPPPPKEVKPPEPVAPPPPKEVKPPEPVAPPTPPPPPKVEPPKVEEVKAPIKEEKPEPPPVEKKEPTPVPSVVAEPPKPAGVEPVPVGAEGGKEGEDKLGDKEKKGEEKGDVDESALAAAAAALKDKDKIEKPDEEKGLRGEFQKTVVGDVSKESQLKDSGAQEESLRRSFAKIAETMDDDMEKGIIEASSPKKDKDEIILFLQKKLEEQRLANQLAERAIKQLEGVEKILDQGLKLRCNLTCTNVCDPCPVKVKKMNNMDNMKQRLDDLMKERDGLQLKVSDLEKQLTGGNGSPDDVTDDQIVSSNELRNRLDRVTGLEIKAQDLVNQLNTECADKQEKPEKPKEQKPAANTDKMKSKISELEKELEKTQQMKVDNARMKMKIQELEQIEKAQDEMRKKIGKMEADYKSKFDDLCKMEVECTALRNQLANTKLMQKERDMLRRQVGDLECCVADLEDEIKRLTSHIDRLTEGRDEQQTKMQTVVSDVRIDLEKKNLLIQKLEEQLAKVQQELEISIKAVKTECLCYKSKIEDLEKMLNSKNAELKSLQDSSKKEKDKLNADICRLKKTHEDALKSENAKFNKLKQQLDNCAKNNEKLQKELEKMIEFKSNENSVKKILIHSRSAIKRVRQEIDMQYKEWEKGSGENCRKVEELKDVIELLESELFQMKQVNEELQTALKDQKKCNCLVGSENKSLKKHSTEIQCIAKHQVEELLTYLKKAQLRIIELEGMLDQKPIKVGQGTGDDDVTCDCDTDLLEKLMKENEILKQGMKTEKVGEESTEQGPTEKGMYNADQDLLNEIKRLKNEISSLESDKLKLEKENENLRTKSQFSKTVEVDSLPTSNDKDKLQNIINAQREEIERLKQEIENLKKQLGKQAQSSSTNMKNLEDTLKTQKDTASKMQIHNKELEDKIKMLMGEIENLKKQLDEMGKIKKQLDECLEKKKTENTQISSQHDKLQTDNQNLKTDMAELENLKKKLAECLENEKKINAEKSSKEEDLRRELENCKNRLKEMEKGGSSDDALKKENEEMKKKLKEMEDIKKQLTDCLNKANDINAQKSSSEKELKKENDDLKNSLNELEKLKKNLAECLEREKKANEALKKSESGSKDSNKFQAKIDALQKQLDECLAREKKTKELVEKESFQSAVQVSPKDLENLEKELDDAKKKLAEANKKLKSIENELEQCRKENMALKGEIDELKKKPAPPTAGKPADNTEELERLRKENQKLKEDNEKLKSTSGKAEPKPAAPAASPTAKTQTPADKRDDLQAEIDRLLKQLEDQKKECDATIKMMKDQWDRDVKNIQNANSMSIEKLQQQHQQQTQDLERRQDSVVKSLKDELRMSILSTEIPTRDKVDSDKKKKDKELTTQTFCVCSEMPKIVPIITTVGADIGVHEVDSPIDKPGRWPKPKENHLAQILFKASNLGIEKLTLNEMRLISSKLNEVEGKLKGTVIKVSKKPSVEEETQSSLMDRIEELKDNLEKKQKSAKHKVVNLQLSIRSMEQKILDTRNVLEKEKKHNAELRARLTMMERDSQLMQVDRDLMKQQTNLQEQHIAELKKTCDCKQSKTKDLKREHKKKKFLKRSRRDSFSSDSTEILEHRIPSKRRSASTPVSGVRSPHHIPSIERVLSPDNDWKKRDKHGACPCCSTRGPDKKN